MTLGASGQFGHALKTPYRAGTRVLREEDEKDYCGIVHAHSDDRDEPGFVKIYDSSNLGEACGCSDSPPVPGWTVTRAAPRLRTGGVATFRPPVRQNPGAAVSASG